MTVLSFLMCCVSTLFAEYAIPLVAAGEKEEIGTF